MEFAMFDRIEDRLTAKRGIIVAYALEMAKPGLFLILEQGNISLPKAGVSSILEANADLVEASGEAGLPPALFDVMVGDFVRLLDDNEVYQVRKAVYLPGGFVSFTITDGFVHKTLLPTDDPTTILTVESTP